jgi:hypothetical protein
MQVYRTCAKILETWFSLETILRRGPLDLSAIQATLIRISNELKNNSEPLSSIKTALQSLNDAILSKSGLGLTSMWSATFYLPLLRERTPQMIALEDLIQSAHRIGNFGTVFRFARTRMS